MTHKSAPREIEKQQEELAAWLQGMPAAQRLFLGLFVSAAAAFYVPLLWLTLTGVWNNVVADWRPALIIGCILAIINLAGYKLNRILLTGVVVSVLAGCYTISLMARMTTLDRWPQWCLQVAYVFSVLLLNSYMFHRYTKLAKI